MFLEGNQGKCRLLSEWGISSLALTSISSLGKEPTVLLFFWLTVTMRWKSPRACLWFRWPEVGVVDDAALFIGGDGLPLHALPISSLFVYKGRSYTSIIQSTFKTYRTIGV